MNNWDMDRRAFLRNSFYSTMLFGAGSAPGFVSNANAAFTNLQNRLLVDMNLNGGPDLRHLVAPAMPSELNATTRATPGYKYWENRYLTQALANDESAWQTRWNNEYHHITINQAGDVNNGLTFGIWKGAGWLIRMYEEGNVALIANSAIGRNRAHDRSQTQLRQGDVFANETETQRSGWGGRLARFTDDNSISLTGNPSPFCFGPVDTPVYDPLQIDNRSFLSITDSRNSGLFEANLDIDQTYQIDDKFARSLKSYYQALRGEAQNGNLSSAYEKAMDHEEKVRFFGSELRRRLDFDIPLLIRALYENIDGINNGGSDNGARRVLRSSSFGRQIRNLYDCIATNDLLSMRVASLSYSGWDSHASQGDRSGNNDVYDPFTNLPRGIERNFRDIFGGPFAGSSDLHGGFSALWEYLDNVDKNRIVFNFSGEFGRQLRQNGNDFSGTDHGDGNLVILVGNSINGGVYGDLFPESELEKYAEDPRRTPDIESLTEMDHIFGKVCNWVSSSDSGVVESAGRVFPRLLETPGTANYPDIESANLLDDLFTI